MKHGALVMLVLVACSGSNFGTSPDAGVSGPDAATSTAEYWPPASGDAWETVKHEDAGLSPAKLEDVLACIGTDASTRRRARQS